MKHDFSLCHVLHAHNGWVFMKYKLGYWNPENIQVWSISLANDKHNIKVLGTYARVALIVKVMSPLLPTYAR